MAKPNISAALTAAQTDEIKSALNSVKNLMPFLINLNNTEKKALQKMGSSSVGFVEDALNVANNHPGVLTANFDRTEFEKDVNLTSALSDIFTVLLPLTEGVSDTLTAVGAEALKQSNIIYAQVKLSAKHDSNMKEIQNRLGERYKKLGSRKTKAAVSS